MGGRVCFFTDMSFDPHVTEFISRKIGTSRHDFTAARDFVLYIDNFDPTDIRRTKGLLRSDMKKDKTSLCGRLVKLEPEEIRKVLETRPHRGTILYV
jgi:hypothetical protein